MKLKKSDLQKGDKVLVIKGPVDKVGLTGEITTIVENGAIVKLGEDWYSPIQFIHLKKIV
jgi:preprotein translocase subunit YajC